MKEAVAAWSKLDEFAGIMQAPPGTPERRPVMSPPPRYIASSDFIHEVQAMLDSAANTGEIADWIVDKMERFGASAAQPVIDMDGNGPQCSWCGMIWPLCGHQHLTHVDLSERGERS